MTNVDQSRIRFLKEAPFGRGPVVCIMARDQRVSDNWALLHAQHLALELKKPLVVLLPITAEYPELTRRQAAFMIAGLRETVRDLARLNIPAAVPSGAKSVISLDALLPKLQPGAIVTDFSPLRASRMWKQQLAERIAIPLIEADAHNIVPAWVASDKQEYAAYTLRPKIHRQLGRYLTDFPAPVKHPFGYAGSVVAPDWNTIENAVVTDDSVAAVGNFTAGSRAALDVMSKFLTNKLAAYNDGRNDPNVGAQSQLSPYLHFGQISAQRVALEAQRYQDDIPSQEAFLEELIVRRELSDNFCLYNPRYDSLDGFPDWARTTLNEHRHDPRPYLYSRDDFEAAATHDELWNAAQNELVLTGKMHGYMRMYWAKKILEWSPTPEDALAAALYLNDKYELDGRDPNGYTGVAWSIGGVHDRPWFERDVFGKVRYMSEGGCRRKFDVSGYIDRISRLRSEVAL